MSRQAPLSPTPQRFTVARAWADYACGNLCAFAGDTLGALSILCHFATAWKTRDVLRAHSQRCYRHALTHYDVIERRARAAGVRHP